MTGNLKVSRNSINIGNGFHVNQKNIEYIVARAYYTVHQYMRSFLDSLKSKARDEIRMICAAEFKKIIKFHH